MHNGTMSAETSFPWLTIVSLLQEMCPVDFCGMQKHDTLWRVCGTPSGEENCLVECDVV